MDFKLWKHYFIMKKVELNKDFSPSIKLRTLFFVYAFSGFILFGIFTYIPVMVLTKLLVPKLLLSFAYLAAMIFVCYWIPRYYETMKYKLTNHEMVWHRGVWFRDTGIVPYNRITNIDITQGPVSRMIGIAKLKIQTAGYSGSKTSAEITIEGVENFEEMRDVIMNFVRGRKPVSTESHYGSENKVLDELVKIRKLLSKK
jgi:membrane protein YdbS with pleckstrin-like domain